MTFLGHAVHTSSAPANVRLQHSLVVRRFLRRLQVMGDSTPRCKGHQERRAAGARCGLSRSLGRTTARSSGLAPEQRCGSVEMRPDTEQCPLLRV
eukprot:3149801-Pleurochrysis_carterae.AAC.3